MMEFVFIGIPILLLLLAFGWFATVLMLLILATVGFGAMFGLWGFLIAVGIWCLIWVIQEN